MVSTVAAVERTLTRDSLVYRYDPRKAAPDGFGTEEGTFTMCTFWLVEALTRMGRIDDARFLFACAGSRMPQADICSGVRIISLSEDIFYIILACVMRYKRGKLFCHGRIRS